MKSVLEITPRDAREEMLALIREVAYAEGDFTLASGKRSPYYIDGRRVTIHPRGTFLTGVLFFNAIEDFLDEPGPWGVTGLTLGADPIITATALLAHLRGAELYPMYCRKEPKGHGAGKQLEGYVEAVKRCVVVEDTATTGASALKAVVAARDAGLDVAAIVVLVDRLEGGRDAAAAAGVAFRSIFSIVEVRGGK